jgi:purine-binding chemotaxis protein CheW
MQIEEILIIKNAHENYGVSTEDINHISRVPSLTPLPLKPSGVRGLCSVGGSVVSMVDMNQLLGIGEVDIEASSSRLLSLNAEHSSNALLVSEVYNTVEICPENIEYIENENDPIVAIYKYKDILVQIISLDELFSKINRVKIESKDVKSGKLKQEAIKEEDSGRFLIFSMSNEKFALNIDYLQEIILSDIEFTEIAGSSEEVLGLVTLRDEILTIIDLRTYYGFEAKTSDDNRILVVSHNGKKIGLYIDTILDIKNIFTKDIEYMSDHFEDKKISGVIHDENSLISFFDHEVLNKIFEKNDSFIDSNTVSNDSTELDEYVMEVIVFKLLGKEYAFEVENVDEIIDMIPSTNVAFSDEVIDGIINIRGQIVTMVSLFKKLDIPTKINDDSKIIVCNINDTKIGFVVDSVSDILNIKKSDIREENDEFFDKILHLDNGNRLVLSMDIDKIVEVEG